VVNLSGPATYKFRVTFRWLGSTGQVLSTAVQSSPACYQPELRPDLVVRSLTAKPIASGASAGQDAYTATIANQGLSAAGTFVTEFINGNGASQTASVSALGSRSSVRQRFVAPPCAAGTTLTVIVDPAHTVDEYNLQNNTLTMECPTPASPTS
jgi:subtilase family serine protease